jgi:hypothetical protein
MQKIPRPKNTAADGFGCRIFVYRVFSCRWNWRTQRDLRRKACDNATDFFASAR